MGDRSCEQIHGYPMCMGQAARQQCTCPEQDKWSHILGPISPEAVAFAMQSVWNEHCADTGNIPECFSVHGPRTTRVSADFRVSQFAERVAVLLNAGLSKDKEARHG